MKSIIKFFVLSIGILVIPSSCKKEEIRPADKNKLELRFENIGDSKVNNFKFQGKWIGDIFKGFKTKYYSFDHINIWNNNAMEQASAKSNYGKIESWISTNNENEWKVLYSGKHTIEVSLFYGCGVGLQMNLKE